MDRGELKKWLHPRLRLRLRIYFAIAIVLLLFIVRDIIQNIFTLHYVLGGLVLGIIIGVLTGRIYRLSWDDNIDKVVSELDVLGGIILTLYLLFEIFRDEILLRFLSSSMVAGITAPLIAGIMLGRLFGLGRRILQILQEERVFSEEK